MHHKGHLGISGNADDPDGVVFTDQNGRSMNGVARARPPTPADMPTVQPYACPLGERLPADCVYFTPGPKPPPAETHDDDPGHTADPAPEVGPHARRRSGRCTSTGRGDTGPPDGSRAPPSAD